jgi:hypothetical protein
MSRNRLLGLALIVAAALAVALPLFLIGGGGRENASLGGRGRGKRVSVGGGGREKGVSMRLRDFWRPGLQLAIGREGNRPTLRPGPHEELSKLVRLPRRALPRQEPVAALRPERQQLRGHRRRHQLDLYAHLGGCRGDHQGPSGRRGQLSLRPARRLDSRCLPPGANAGVERPPHAHRQPGRKRHVLQRRFTLLDQEGLRACRLGRPHLRAWKRRRLHRLPPDQEPGLLLVRPGHARDLPRRLRRR